MNSDGTWHVTMETLSGNIVRKHSSWCNTNNTWDGDYNVIKKATGIIKHGFHISKVKNEDCKLIITVTLRISYKQCFPYPLRKLVKEIVLQVKVALKALKQKLLVTNFMHCQKLTSFKVWSDSITILLKAHRIDFCRSG